MGWWSTGAERCTVTLAFGTGRAVAQAIKGLWSLTQAWQTTSGACPPLGELLLFLVFAIWVVVYILSNLAYPPYSYWVTNSSSCRWFRSGEYVNTSHCSHITSVPSQFDGVINSGRHNSPVHGDRKKRK